MEIQPTNPVDVFLKTLFMLLVVMVFGVQSTVVSSPPSVRVSEVQVVPHVIEELEVIVLESYPMQVQLVVKGYQSDGCMEPVITRQYLNGHSISIEIFRELPLDVACPAIIKPYEETISVEGTFESGTYTFDVNGFVVEVEM